MKPEQEPAPRHEVTPWKPRPFVLLSAGFYVFMAVMFLVLARLTISWTHGVWPPRAPVPPAQSAPGWNSSPPQLQTDAAGDLQRWQQYEYQLLHTTRWTDDTHRYATIPIEKAMDLVANAAAGHRLDQLLPAPQPATPIELQNQKSAEAPKTP